MRLKVLTKQLLAVLAGLALAGSTQAQYVTGGQYLQNATNSGGGYDGWSGATFSYTPTGIEVQAPTNGGYGGAYFVINSGVQVMNANDTEVQLTITVNGDINNWVYFSPGQLVLNDDLPPPTSYAYGEPYSGPNNNPTGPPTCVWNGNVGTMTVALAPGEITKIQGGSDHIYAFNLDVDPSVLPNMPGGIYDITFNSIELIPEPATVSLVGLGLLGLLGLRRRRTS
jgi:hypothetical protein